MWFEHTAFWSGVRRATIAPQSPSFMKSNFFYKMDGLANAHFKIRMGSTGIWTRDLSHPKRESYP